MFFISDPEKPSVHYTAVWSVQEVTRFAQNRTVERVDAMTCEIVAQRSYNDGTKCRTALSSSTVYCSPEDAFDYHEGMKKSMELAVRDAFDRGNPLRAQFHQWLADALTDDPLEVLDWRRTVPPQTVSAVKV